MRQKKRLNTEDRKAQVVAIASRVFYESGYEMGSLGKIAKEAGVTKAALYHHFKNKEGILYSIISNTLDQFLVNLKEISRRNVDPLKELKEMISLLISEVSERTDTKILIEEEVFLSKKYIRILENKKREIATIYEHKLKEIARAGILRNINMTLAKFSLFGIIIWLYQWYKPDGKLSLERIKRDIIEIILHGLIKEDQF